MKTLWKVMGWLLWCLAFAGAAGIGGLFIWHYWDIRQLEDQVLMGRISLSALYASVLVWMGGVTFTLRMHRQLVRENRELMERIDDLMKENDHMLEAIQHFLKEIKQRIQDTGDDNRKAMKEIEDERQEPFREFTYAGVNELTGKMNAQADMLKSLTEKVDELLAKDNSEKDEGSGS